MISHAVEETRKIGQRIAQVLASADVVVLQGELGAGKTHLVQGIVEGLGVPPEVANSPTFVIIQEYAGRIPIFHIDAYRLRDIDEFVELGADEILGSEAVCLIEWGDRVAEVLPRDRLTIRIESTGETEREFHLTASGPRSTALVSQLQASITQQD